MESESIFLEVIQKPMPQNLYHYTSSKGLLGIIGNGKLWVTKTQYLNDSTELHLGFKLIQNEIKNQLETGSIVRSSSELKQMNEQMDNIYNDYNETDTGGTNLAVASFSEEEDQLSLWRGYCKVGDGYSLGFYGDKLVEEIQDKAYFLPCIYDEVKQKRLVREVVNCCSLQKAGEVISGDGFLELEKLSFEEAVLLISPIIKHKKFYEEKEWRLVYRGNKKDTQFRSGVSSIIPYWEIEIDLLKTLCQIVIGPTPLKEQSKNAVRTLLRKKNMYIIHRDDGVKNSEIPFGNI